MTDEQWHIRFARINKAYRKVLAKLSFERFEDQNKCAHASSLNRGKHSAVCLECGKWLAGFKME